MRKNLSFLRSFPSPVLSLFSCRLLYCLPRVPDGSSLPDGGRRRKRGKRGFPGDFRSGFFLLSVPFFILFFCIFLRFFRRSPLRMEKFSARTIRSLVSMRSEIIPESLQHIGRQLTCAHGVVIGERARKGRHGQPVFQCLRRDFPPRGLRVRQRIPEERCQHQTVRPRLLIPGLLPPERLRNIIQKFCPDDASSAPEQSDPGEIQIPGILFRCGFEQLESLGVCTNFGSEK